MNYEDYMEEVKKHIKEYLTDEWKTAEVMLRKETKLNGINRYGVLLNKPGDGFAPVLSLNEYYRLYSNGASMEDTLRKMGREYMEAAKTAPSFGIVEYSYESIRSRLILCAVNAKMNEELLATVPHQRVEDLAIVYRCILAEQGDNIASVLIKNDHLKRWGIGADVLHEDAKNSMKVLLPYTLHSMDYIISEFSGFPSEESTEEMQNSRMFILSNNRSWQGASYLFCPEVLEDVSNILGENYLILPSSIHELIIVRQRENYPIQALRDMVCEVNRTKVALEERLSDEIYQYDAEQGRISMVSDGEIQQGMHFGV